jgi:hypothetical protein
MSFVSILQKIGMIAGKAAPELISMVNPPLGAIVGSVLNSILLTEANVGPGQGSVKKENALGAIQVAIPLIVKLMESATHKDLADDALLASGMAKMNDAVVDILNAFRILPKA